MQYVLRIIGESGLCIYIVHVIPQTFHKNKDLIISDVEQQISNILPEYCEQDAFLWMSLSPESKHWCVIQLEQALPDINPPTCSTLPMQFCFTERNPSQLLEVLPIGRETQGR